MTLHEDGPLKIGASYQVNWTTLDGKYSESSWTDGAYNGSGGAELETDIIVFQFAPGISYEFFDDLHLYCGPLWQWIDGEGDITQDSPFGGFIGFHKNIDSDTTVNFEWNATGSSNAFAFSIAKKF